MATKKPTTPAKQPPAPTTTDAPTTARAVDAQSLPTEALPTVRAVDAQSLPTDAPTTARAVDSQSLPASSNVTATAHRSAIEALQAELDDERMRHLTARMQLERQVTALQLTLDELRADLAQSTARSRELEAQLQQLRTKR
jgi:hypothetical protein